MLITQDIGRGGVTFEDETCHVKFAPPNIFLSQHWHYNSFHLLHAHIGILVDMSFAS